MAKTKTQSPSKKDKKSQPTPSTSKPSTSSSSSSTSSCSCFPSCNTFLLLFFFLPLVLFLTLKPPSDVGPHTGGFLVLLKLAQTFSPNGPPNTPMTTWTDSQWMRVRAGRRRLAESFGVSGPPSDISLAVAAEHMIKGVPCRIYKPHLRKGETNTTPLPVALFIHGGGWAEGETYTYEKLLYRVADTAHVMVVGVDYRLAPQHKFPAGLDDCYTVFEWLATEGAMLGVDTSQIVVFGDSAGGNLAAALVLRAQKENPELVSAIKSQLLLYPATDLTLSHPSVTTYGNGYYLSLAKMTQFRDMYVPSVSDRTNPLVSPYHADPSALASMPSTLIITAECDPLRDEAEAFGSKLQTNGVDVTVTRYNGTIHGFFMFPGRIEGKAQALTQIAEYVRDSVTAVDTSSGGGGGDGGGGGEGEVPGYCAEPPPSGLAKPRPDGESGCPFKHSGGANPHGHGHPGHQDE